MVRSSTSSVILDPDPAPSRELDSDAPFRILLLGDFTGRANRRLNSGLAGRRPILVDLDNFEEVMEQLQPGLRLPRAELRFRELDDFHPDHIYRSTSIFQHLAGLSYEPPRAAVSAHAASAPAASGPAPSAKALLDSILQEAQLEESPVPVPASGVEPPDDLAAFIKKAMAPHLEARPDAGQVEWVARVQAVARGEMRAILHHPDFQALEAAWRAAWMLLRGLADDVRIYLLDATLDELFSDTAALERLVSAPRDPWALLVGNYVFAETDHDARRLHALAGLARAAGAPFLAEVQPPSGETAPESWQQLRQSPEARWIGLALPRFLLRLPYGSATSPVEAFAFEEMTGSVHADYLWGNPAFCCAYLIGQSFRSHGWNLRPGMDRRVQGLPLHPAKPCAEILLSENDAEFLLDRGYMPLASIKDQDAALLVRFQSIADPLAPLSGRWS